MEKGTRLAKTARDVDKQQTVTGTKQGVLCEQPYAGFAQIHNGCLLTLTEEQLEGCLLTLTEEQLEVFDTAISMHMMFTFARTG